ncbi:MAG: hypothetical protein V1245_04845 [Arenicellales bacterium]|nr:hypothetical protein [Arenicellales bacterium]HCV21759.1 hypothetical protein [Gammaproteobacteria bacterium]MDP6313460.1 hypothetical protein [Arenicellales bacterium]MDP7119311.1 hypothetical protein [Arenicellales bacterium]MDP7191668.1 hypothetical protein [Arenicellales bacterium]
MFKTPADVESAFFQAIKRADSDEIKAIETSWRRIYSHPASIRFSLDKARRLQQDTLVLHRASPVPGSRQPVDIHPGWVP